MGTTKAKAKPKSAKPRPSRPRKIRPVAERDWVTSDEAALEADVSRDSIQNWITLGIPSTQPGGKAVRVMLAASKIGGRLRIKKEDLARFLAAFRIPGGESVPTETDAEFRRRAARELAEAEAALNGD